MDSSFPRPHMSRNVSCNTFRSTSAHIRVCLPTTSSAEGVTHLGLGFTQHHPGVACLTPLLCSRMLDFWVHATGHAPAAGNQGPTAEPLPQAQQELLGCRLVLLVPLHEQRKLNQTTQKGRLNVRPHLQASCSNLHTALTCMYTNTASSGILCKVHNLA